MVTIQQALHNAQQLLIAQNDAVARVAEGNPGLFVGQIPGDRRSPGLHFDDPALESEILLSYIIEKPRAYLRAWPERILTPEVEAEFNALIARRLQGEPIAYITGKKEFWSLDLLVTPATLIPRPETECLIEMALSLFSHQEKIKVADLGTGSGAIALALASEHPTWQISATDISEAALAVAKMNAERLHIHNVSFYQGSWCEALPSADFDLMISNPPYIAQEEWGLYEHGLLFEPRDALVSGLDGFDSIREIIQAAKGYLKSNGCLMIEHGFWQGPVTRELFEQARYTEINSVCDLSGQERFTLGKCR